jgi:hypothetical protein
MFGHNFRGRERKFGRRPRWWPDTRTDWLTVSQLQDNFDFDSDVFSRRCGGRWKYLHCSLASRKKREKGNPVKNEIARYGFKHCGTWIHEWQSWQGPTALAWVNYRPILSSERALHTKSNHICLRIISVERKKNCSQVPDGGLRPG